LAPTGQRLQVGTLARGGPAALYAIPPSSPCSIFA
jgi:hypothetical protein